MGLSGQRSVHHVLCTSRRQCTHPLGHGDLVRCRKRRHGRQQQRRSGPGQHVLARYVEERHHGRGNGKRPLFRHLHVGRLVAGRLPHQPRQGRPPCGQHRRHGGVFQSGPYRRLTPQTGRLCTGRVDPEHKVPGHHERRLGRLQHLVHLHGRHEHGHASHGRRHGFAHSASRGQPWPQPTLLRAGESHPCRLVHRHGRPIQLLDQRRR